MQQDILESVRAIRSSLFVMLNEFQERLDHLENRVNDMHAILIRIEHYIAQSTSASKSSE